METILNNALIKVAETHPIIALIGGVIIITVPVIISFLISRTQVMKQSQDSSKYSEKIAIMTKEMIEKDTTIRKLQRDQQIADLHNKIDNVHKESKDVSHSMSAHLEIHEKLNKKIFDKIDELGASVTGLDKTVSVAIGKMETQLNQHRRGWNENN